MSFQDMALAVQAGCKNSSQKLVLLMLANHCNGHTRQCNPSHKRLADECSMSVASLKVQILALQDQGFLVVHRRTNEGVSLPNQYELILGGRSESNLPVGQILAGGGLDSGRGVGQILATNLELKPIIETVINKQEGERASAQPRKRDNLPGKPPDVDQQVWDDWLQLRKAKKAPVTQTVISQAVKESEKAGIELNQFLAIWCARGTQGFQAAWIKDGDLNLAKAPMLSFAERDELAAKKRMDELMGRNQKPFIDVETKEVTNAARFLG